MKAIPFLSRLEVLDKRGLFWKSGVLGVSVIAVGMLSSALFYRGRMGESFNPLNHFVSELGEVGVAPLAPAFNVGLIVGGLCMVLSVFGLALRVRGLWGIFLALVGLFCGLSGALVGVFPMTNLTPHFFWAMNFFNSGLALTVIFSLAVVFGNHGLPKWLALPSLLPVASFGTFLFFPQPFPEGSDSLEAATAFLSTSRPPVLGLAVFEWLAVLSIMLWALMIALTLRSKRGQAG